MSATQDQIAPHLPPGGHEVGEAGHGSLRDYVTGFTLSVILTAIPFWLVMSHALPNRSVTAFILVLFAVAQVVVHMIYFLHMNAKAEGGWNLLALIFTLLVVMIVLSGTLWVMYHLNHNMMPMPHDMG